MNVKNIVEKLQQNINSCVFVDEVKYIIQIYSNGMQGNIKRLDDTVLCRFYINDESIAFAFAKKNIPYEFGYEKHPVSVNGGIEEIRKISHCNAEELYRVLTVLINNN